MEDDDEFLRGKFFSGEPCADCGRTDHILARFDTDDVGRCADCHSIARAEYYTSEDWLEE